MKPGVKNKWDARRCLLLGICAVLALAWLGSCAGRSPDEAIHRLKSMQKIERTKAANELIRFDADEVVPLLIDEADSGYIRVRFEVVNLLGRFKDPRAVSTLVAALGDKSPRVAAMAAWALGQVRSPDALPALLKYARDPSVEVRQYVLGALGPCHSHQVDPALSDSAFRVVSRALKASKIKWRIAALLSMREYGYRDAAEEVIRMSRDPSPEVRHVAVQALGQIGSGRHAPPEGVDPIAPVSERMRNNIYEALITALDADEVQSIRTKAVRSLDQVGDARVVPQLEQLVREGSDEDRREAQRALDKLNLQHAVAKQ
jgi:HEAT repeat protein